MNSSLVRGRDGLTMVEVLITAAIFAVMVAAVVPLFTTTSRGFTSMQASSSLTGIGQGAVNFMLNRLKETRRMFNRGTDYWTFLPASLRASTQVLAGSRLPDVLDVALSSAPASATGNLLYFTSMGPSLSNNLVRVNTSIFNVFHLKAGERNYLSGQPVLEVWAWESVPYVDVTSIQLLPPADQTATLVWLFDQGYVLGWNPMMNAVDAFSVFSATGGVAAVPAHVIEAATDRLRRHRNLIDTKMASGLNLSISRNTSTSSVAYPVPRFAVPTSNFPHGFEVLAAGPPTNRQVFLRMVLVARGGFKGEVSRELTVLANVRDVL